MDDAVRARAAARNAVADVAPVSLRDRIDERVKEAAMTPGVLTRLAARAADPDVDPATVDQRAAGVELIYAGLTLTRSLARTPPWPDNDDHVDEDLDILAADVLVARGFRILAATEAAAKAVETVRNFGRDETDRVNDRPNPTLADRTLEADVFELAVIAGTAAADVIPPPGIRSFAVDLACSYDETPTASDRLSESAVDALTELVQQRQPSAMTPDRVWASSSVTDP